MWMPSSATSPSIRFMAGEPMKPATNRFFGLVVQVQRGVALLQHAVLQHRDPVAHGHGLDLVVGHVDGGDAEPGLQRGDLGAGGDPELGVQVRQRLVHQEHLRRPHDRAAHGDALTLTTGEGLRLAVEEVLQAQQVGRFLDALLPLGLRHAGHLQREAHVVAHGHVGIQGVVLEHHRDVAVLRRQVGDVTVTDEDAAGVDLLQAREHAERGGLAATGRSDQDHELAVADVEIELVDGGVICTRVDASCVLETDCGHATLPFHGQVRARRSVVEITARGRATLR